MLPRLGGMLFGLPFAVVGIGMAGYSVYQVYRWYDSSRWVEVAATIDSLDLRVNDGEGTTYGVDCQYHYRVNGRRFSGENPSFYGGTDNLGSFQKDLYSRLKAAKESENATVWIDPNAPHRSVLDRSFRAGFFSFSQIFALAFGSSGLAIFAAAFATRNPRIKHEALNIESSSRPTRAVCGVLMLYCGAQFLFGLLVSLLTIADGQLGSGVFCFLLTSCFGVVALVTWRIRKKHRQPGRLTLPIKDAPRSEQAKIILPASWQGPVDMDVRWTVPRPPTNQIGLEDEDVDLVNVDLPTVSGTVRETHIPVPMPDVSDNVPKGMPLKLEVKGTIGGYRYSDEFQVPENMIQQLAFQTNKP